MRSMRPVLGSLSLCESGTLPPCSVTISIIDHIYYIILFPCIIYMSDSNVITPKSNSSEDEYYKQWTKYRILEEAYNRDKWANRRDSSNKQSSNIITINEIQQMYTALGDLESIRREASGMDMKADPLNQFVGTFDEDTITITNRGRTHYDENKNTE